MSDIGTGCIWSSPTFPTVLSPCDRSRRTAGDPDGCRGGPRSSDKLNGVGGVCSKLSSLITMGPTAHLVHLGAVSSRVAVTSCAAKITLCLS